MNDIPSRLIASLADRYLIERELGAGGMATVYLAEDLKHRRKVALKVLRPELGALLGPERFFAEINVTANLQHPHLVPLFDSGEADGLLYYVMPYIAGESLRQRLERERQLPIEEAIRIAVAVANAVHYAHRHGVIHRDIKPENILLHDGEPVVTDFGIALAISNAGGARVTQSGLSLGTPQYMSPEQATGDRMLDARTDIYGIGAVLYEMLAGEPPVTGPNSQAIIAKLLTERPTRLRVVRDAVPQQIDDAVARALAKTPADRFSNAGDFASALQAGLANTVPAQPVRLWAKPARKYLYAGFAVLFAAVAVLQGRRLGWTSVGTLPLLGDNRQASDSDSTNNNNASLLRSDWIVVLPFENVNADTANESFAEGLRDAVEFAIGSVKGVKLIEGASADAFVGKQVPPTEIARQLRVRKVMEASVRRDGSQYRVNVHLVDGVTGNREWSKTYRREVTDYLGVEEEISRDIVAELWPGVDVSAGLDGPGTKNPLAWDLYIKARHLWNDMRPDALQQALELLEKAVKLDPNFANAYVAIAETYEIQAQGMRPGKWEGLMAAALKQALSINPDQPDALILSARLESDPVAAESLYVRGIARRPSANGYTLYAQFLNLRGRHPESLDIMKRAVERDPLSPFIHANLAARFMFLGMHRDALNTADAAIQLGPTSSLPHFLRGLIFMHMSDYTSSIPALEKAAEYASPGLGPLPALLYAYERGGRPADAQRILRQLEDASRRSYIPATEWARVYLGLRDREKSVAFAKRAYEEEGIWVFGWFAMFAADELGGDEEFRTLLRRADMKFLLN